MLVIGLEMCWMRQRTEKGINRKGRYWDTLFSQKYMSDVIILATAASLLYTDTELSWKIMMQCTLEFLFH